jgi:hypothetical protein
VSGVDGDGRWICEQSALHSEQSHLAGQVLALRDILHRRAISVANGVKRKSRGGGLSQADAFDPKLKPSIPHRSALRCSLFFERPTPRARTYASNALEMSREMTLIAEAAFRGHIGERRSAIAQLFLGERDALLN